MSAHVPNIEESCICGRRKQLHCPKCGRTNYYALRKTATRPHPQSGQIVNDITIYRCRICGVNFDQLAYEFECAAPPSLRQQQNEKRESLKEHWCNKVIRGDHFTSNDIRAFNAVMGPKGYDYYTFKRLCGGILGKQETQALTDVKPTKPSAIKLPFKLDAPKEPDKNAAFIEHVAHCSECQLGDPCQVGQLLIANPEPKL